jgi:subtilase family serine protease
LTVVSTAGRAITVSGAAATVSRAFSTSLGVLSAANGRTTLVAKSPLTLSAALKAEGASVVAFSGPPKMHTHSHAILSLGPVNRTSASGSYYYDDLKQAYGYPSYQVYDGTGASVAVVIDSNIVDSDVTKMFTNENFAAVTGKPIPTVTHVLINGGASSTADIDEASLDVQQMIGGAPGAKVTVVDIPSLSDDDIIAGYTYIVNAGGTAYQAVNSSFGECELFYTAPYNGGVDYTSVLDEYTPVFQQGNAEGITFVASSGDSGGLGCPDTNYLPVAYGGTTPTAPSRFLPGVEFPAASPYVTAVGGTNLITSYTPGVLTSTYVAENANGDPETAYDPYGVGVNVVGGYWGAGGGVSTIYTQPAYQALVTTGSTYRTVPDVGMQVGGCPGGISVTPCGPSRSSVIVYINGKAGGFIGTSVASPEFVGALALYVEKLGTGAGNLNTYLYTQAALQNAGGATVYNRYIPGFDGRYTQAYPAGGYDYLVGNGTPMVANLFGLGTVLAGTPQSASNP